MKVKVVNYTRNGLKILADAVRVTAPFFNDMKDNELVKHMVKHDYSSVLEHVYFTFKLKDISVALSRELLEHRIASHTAKSTRYVSQAEEMSVYLPDSIKEELRIEVENHIKKTHELYKKIEKEVDRETARYVLPMGLKCTYVWTINCRSLLNFLRLRLCVNAAPEMRELAGNIREIVTKIYPEIFQGIDCRGSQWSICPEPKKRSCGKYPSGTEKI
jgi:thymidylate synthase (FAD)